MVTHGHNVCICGNNKKKKNKVNSIIKLLILLSNKTSQKQCFNFFNKQNKNITPIRPFGRKKNESQHYTVLNWKEKFPEALLSLPNIYFLRHISIFLLRQIILHLFCKQSFLLSFALNIRKMPVKCTQTRQKFRFSGKH